LAEHGQRVSCPQYKGNDPAHTLMDSDCEDFVNISFEKRLSY